MKVKKREYLSEKPHSQKQRNKLRLAIYVLLILCLMILGGVFAKYIAEFNSEHRQADASEFYFESDFLSTEGSSYNILCSELSDATIDFRLLNYADELNFSNSDIQYTIEYELHGIKKEETGILTGGDPASSAAHFELKSFGLNAFATQAVVNVTAHAVAPYDRVLKGTFTLIESENALNYAVSDSIKSNVGTVTVTTGGVGGSITISIPPGCFFDPTNTFPSGYTITGDTVLSFVANPDAEYAFVYLKEKLQVDYTEEVRAVLVTGNTN